MVKPCKHLKEMKPCIIPKEAQEKRVEHVRKVLETRGRSPKEIADILGE